MSWIAQKGIDVVDENSDDDVLPVNDDDTEKQSMHEQSC